MELLLNRLDEMTVIFFTVVFVGGPIICGLTWLYYNTGSRKRRYF